MVGEGRPGPTASERGRHGGVHGWQTNTGKRTCSGGAAGRANSRSFRSAAECAGATAVQLICLQPLGASHTRRVCPQGLAPHLQHCNDASVWCRFSRARKAWSLCVESSGFPTCGIVPGDQIAWHGTVSCDFQSTNLFVCDGLQIQDLCPVSSICIFRPP